MLALKGAIIESGLVAMVAISDEDGFLQHQGIHSVDDFRTHYPPEAVFHPLAIGEGNDRGSFPADPQGMIDHHGRVRIKGKDRAEVGFAGQHQPEPLVFHGLKGPFMGTDRTRAEIFQAQGTDKSIAGLPDMGREGKGQFVVVEGRLLITNQDMGGLPLPKRFSGADMRIVVGSIQGVVFPSSK